MLARVYAQIEPPPDATARFTDLLVRFDNVSLSASQTDDVAFRDLMVAHTAALRRYAISLTHDPTAADDLVQDTLVRAWRNRRGFALGTNFEA